MLTCDGWRLRYGSAVAGYAAYGEGGPIASESEDEAATIPSFEGRTPGLSDGHVARDELQVMGVMQGAREGGRRECLPAIY